jgi:hypothetical protein
VSAGAGAGLARALGLTSAAALMTALSGCPSPEPPQPEGEAAWSLVLDEEDLDRALLSVWGTGPSDVFAVGGPLGNTGRESLALHFDGTAWRELSPGGEETFWWVNGTSSSDVWMVGEKGRISHFDGASFTEHTSGTTATLWGVWAFSPSDAWAVGGTPEGGTAEPNDVVLRWDGAAWTPEALPGAPLGRSLYKVWGTSSDDLYVVGEAATIWRRKDGAWKLESDPPLAKGTLFTVFGCSATDVYAVGGRDILRSDGAAWERVDFEVFSGINGVSCGGPGEVALVGFGSFKARLVDGVWVDEFDLEPYGVDFHAVWADKSGAFWAVGGDFQSKPAPGQPRKGVVARYGRGQVARSISP